MKFTVNSSTAVEQTNKKGEKFTNYRLNLIARRTVKAGGLTQVKATSVFIMNKEDIAKGTEIEVPLDRMSIRESRSEDGNVFTWLTIKPLQEAQEAPVAEKKPAGAAV